MFIRKTLKSDPQTRKSYCAYYLVESCRTDRGPRQKVLLYMGPQIDLPEAEHKLLGQRIHEIIAGQNPLIPYAEQIERLAQGYATQVINRLSEDTAKQEIAIPPSLFVNIDVNTMEKSTPRTVGTEHLLLQMANQLQLPKKLQSLGFSPTEIVTALGSIIGRAANPGSERATNFWLEQNSGLGELLDYDFKKSSLNNLYRISDKLLEHKDVLERHLEKVEQHCHGYQSTIALYDLTNTYMEGQATVNPKAAYGVSKEKRYDCPLVTLGIVMNEHGFLHHSQVFPGNASEPKTLEEMLSNLRDHHSLFPPVVILDAGIATDDNLKWLRGHQYKYVVSTRQNAPSIELEGQLVPVGDRHGLVKAALAKDTGEEEKWLYCESLAKTATATKMKESFRKRFEEDLHKLAQGLLKPRGRKKYTKILERVGRLKEKHKRISGCYRIDVTKEADGENATSVQWEAVEEKMEDKLNGSYFLRTNLVDKGPKELWTIYNSIRGVEDAFRFMKSSLGLRPIHHQLEHRTDGHLWITVLAYHLIQNCLYQLKKSEISYSWETIRKIIGGRVRVTVSAKTKEGKILHYRSSTKTEGEQQVIYKALRLSPQILQAKKMIL